MIYLLFVVLCTEMMSILLLLFETPFRYPLLVGLDRLKRGTAQLIVKSVSATVFVVMIYNIYSVIEIRCRPVDALNPSDHVILGYRMLEASLIGFSLFLLLMINSLHPYINEVSILKSMINSAESHNRVCEYIKKNTENLAESIKQDISGLRTKITKLEFECATKEKEVNSIKSNSGDLKDRLEGLVVDYDCLFADNKDLRGQLRDIKERRSPSRSNENKMVFFSWDEWGL